MCLAYPGTITEISGRSLTISSPSGPKKVLLGDDLVKIGDHVLIQMGIVTKVISPEEYKSISQIWGPVGDRASVMKQEVP